MREVWWRVLILLAWLAALVALAVGAFEPADNSPANSAGRGEAPALRFEGNLSVGC